MDASLKSFTLVFVMMTLLQDGLRVIADDSEDRRLGLPCGRCPAHLNRGAVCGTDGQTYHSICRLRHSACKQWRQRGQTGLRLAHVGFCPVDSYRGFRNKTVTCGITPCPPSNMFVCGDDGQTYRSLCHLRLANCREKRLIRIASRGPCHKTSIASENAFPVATEGAIGGSDGDAAGSMERGDGEEEDADEEGEEEEEEEDVEDDDMEGEDGDDDDDKEGKDDDDSDSDEENEDNESTTAPPTVSSVMTSTFSTATPPQTTRVFSAVPADPYPEITTPAVPSTPRSTLRPTVSCPTSCPLEVNYVCGTNGQTYNSECLLRSAACQAGDPGIQVAYIGPCVEPLYVPVPHGQVPPPPEPDAAVKPVTAAMPDRPERHSYCPTEKECSLLYLPVCGSDGVTYLSWCHMSAVACETKSESLTVAHMGECVDQANGCDEACSDQFEPVCGSDNMTYYSECSMQRIACLRDEELPVVRHTGTCIQSPLVCPENCPGINDPVCGTDGNSYPSLCVITLAACQSNEDQEIQVAYRGLCINEPCQKSCPERHYTPVCGSNGRTYQNECFLWLDMCRHPELVRFDKDCNLAIP